MKIQTDFVALILDICLVNDYIDHTWKKREGTFYVHVWLDFIITFSSVKKGFESTWIAWEDFGVVRINFVKCRNDFERKSI